MTRAGVTILALASALTLSACASSGGGPQASRDPELIERGELESGDPSLSVFSAIQTLRPSWLRPREVPRGAPQGSMYPGVVLNNRPQDDIEILRSVLARDVETLRYISSRNAATLYGSEYANGMIEVTMLAGDR